jgi:hypothetical protein
MDINEAAIANTAIGPATINSAFSLIDSGFQINILLPPYSSIRIVPSFGCLCHDPKDADVYTL